MLNVQTDTTVTSEYRYYFIDPLSAGMDINITLPSDTSLEGIPITFKRVSSTFDIYFLGSYTFEGAALPQILLTTSLDSFTIILNGSNWNIVD